MTRLLQKAFVEVSLQPQDLQDAIAALVFAELEAEQRWDESFARSQGALSALVDEAIADHRVGGTRPLKVR